MVPEEEHLKQQPRRSMAFFVHPDDEVVISPLDGSKGDFEPITAVQHLSKRFKQTYVY